MSDESWDESDEMSGAELDKEIARQEAELKADQEAAGSLSADLGLGPESLGIENMSGEQLDQLIEERSGGVVSKDPAVRAALRASAEHEKLEQFNRDDEEERAGAVSTAGMTDSEFLDFINRNRSYAAGGH